MNNSPLNAQQQLAEIILGQPLNRYVAAKRADGLAWRAVAAAIAADTAGRVTISHEALRLWYGDDLAAATEASAS